MPALPPRQLVEVIESAIFRSGESGVLVSSMRAHPRKFVVTGPVGDSQLWVYAWTLTRGGRPQLVNEYRIQMTTVSSPLPLNPAGLTVLIGYEPNLGMFAGFDLERHRRFTTGSPSVQIDITALHQGLQDGFGFHYKDNTEIAIGVRPDQFMNYARNSEELHRAGRERRTFAALQRGAALEPVRPADLRSLAAQRRRIVETVRRLSRAASFREQVLSAYGNRCAVTRMQLGLVDAAHILPVPAPGSADHVCNGLALSPTYHRAFDRGLIYLDDHFRMRANPEKEGELERMDLVGGMRAFKSALGRIHLPANREQRPDPRFIRRANKYRRITAA